MNFENGKRTFRPSETVSWTDAPGELVIFDQRTDKYHSLNVSASAIWRELATGHTEDAIVEALARKFGASREKILPDVTDFLAAALSTGLIVAGADEHQ